MLTKGQTFFFFIVTTTGKQTTKIFLNHMIYVTTDPSDHQVIKPERPRD